MVHLFFSCRRQKAYCEFSLNQKIKELSWYRLGWKEKNDKKNKKNEIQT
jgi:hypothetical protein